MLKEVEGFIFKETPYGETSKIISVFTKEYGLISIMCKGAKSIKSKDRALTLRFTYAKFNIYYKENKLSLFKSADIIKPLKNINSDIVLISYLSYLVDLTTQVLKQSNDEAIYEDFINTVLKLEDGLDPLVLMNILELKFLDYLGVGINLNECIICGSKTNIATIDGDKGGYICLNCLTDERIVSKKVIQMLRMYYYVNIKSISKLDVDNSTKNEINFFLDMYYDRYTGLYLKSKDFLKNLASL